MPSTRALKTRIRSAFGGERIRENHTQGVDEPFVYDDANSQYSSYTSPEGRHFAAMDRLYAQVAWWHSPESERYKSNRAQEWFAQTVDESAKEVARLRRHETANDEDASLARFMAHEAMAAINRTDLGFHSGGPKIRPETVSDLQARIEGGDVVVEAAESYASQTSNNNALGEYTVLACIIIDRMVAKSGNAPGVNPYSGIDLFGRKKEDQNA